MIPGRILSAAAGLGAALLAAGPAHAGADLTQLGLSRSQVEALNAQLTAPVIAPGIAFGSPVGFGAGWGEAYVGVGGNTLPQNSNNPDNVDGSASVGFGLGDPSVVAVEATVTTISLRNSFGDSGNTNFKISRLLPGRSSIAIGQDNTWPWGDATQVRPSTYAAFTTMFDLSPASPRAPWTVSLNVGAGDHRFKDPGEAGAGVFGSIAIVPIRQLSVIVDYTGRDTNAAVSVVPFPRLPAVLTLGAINLGHRLGRDTEFAGGVGYLIRF